VLVSFPNRFFFPLCISSSSFIKGDHVYSYSPSIRHFFSSCFTFSLSFLFPSCFSLLTLRSLASCILNSTRSCQLVQGMLRLSVKDSTESKPDNRKIKRNRCNSIIFLAILKTMHIPNWRIYFGFTLLYVPDQLIDLSRLNISKYKHTYQIQ